jgi:hypothetical protein
MALLLWAGRKRGDWNMDEYGMHPIWVGIPFCFFSSFLKQQVAAAAGLGGISRGLWPRRALGGFLQPLGLRLHRVDDLLRHVLHGS